jgi:hypothetical protein
MAVLAVWNRVTRPGRPLLMFSFFRHRSASRKAVRSRQSRSTGSDPHVS